MAGHWTPRANPWLIAVAVMLATFMVVLDTSIAVVALPYIAGNLGATQDESGDEPERLAMYRFGVETMEEHRIRVLTTSDMNRVADTARRELVG